MRCENCGTENINEAKFCCRCGSPLARSGHRSNRPEDRGSRRDKGRERNRSTVENQVIDVPYKEVQDVGPANIRPGQNYDGRIPEYRKRPKWMIPAIGGGILALIILVVVGVLILKNRSGNDLQGGTSLTNAKEIDFNKQYTGTYRNKAAWYTFTTGKEKDVPYTIIVDNTTVDSGDIIGYLCEKDGTKITPTTRSNGSSGEMMIEADQDGTASSSMFDTLEPNKDYYIQLTGDGRTKYSLRVTDPNGKPYDDAAGREVLSKNDDYKTATNMDEAPLLEINTRYQGKYKNGYSWVAFTTSKEEGVPYTVTVENQTPGNGSITGYLYNENGEVIKPTSKNNNSGGDEMTEARDDGTPDSGTFEDLEPETTYFMRFTANDRAKYQIEITDGKK